ncbi:MAG: SDR family oxidoreductase [Acidobacteriota bacterium]|nr:SDR family oxidoreductase [Acidobacteriota bacterium]
MPADSPLILLTGATGYIGGRLLAELESKGHRLRCLARRPAYLRARVAPSTEVVQGDIFDPASLRAAMAGVDTAFYLVHSMSSGAAFAENDRRAAGNFSAVARESGVRRIVYLGGLGHGEKLSSHLASRQEVGRILRESGVPAIEFRAGIIIGSGSLSFEMIRALVEKLPVMIAPRWVRTPTQPIAIEDVIAYLAASIDVEIPGTVIFEIGGADRVSYFDLLMEYARQRGLKRLIIPLPLLTPWLSSLWLGLVTPLYARVGRELIEGLRNETVVRDSRALDVFPLRPRRMRQAIERALHYEDREIAFTRWSDAVSSLGERHGWGGARFGSRIVDSRAVHVPVPPEAAFAPIKRIGGKTGWYYANWLWRLRGLIDIIAGGAGMRRGRRDPEKLLPGDTVDWWRTEAVEPNRLLRLAAEMKLPGRAWLQFELTPENSGTSIRQTAIFDPFGLAGLLYWYGLYPAHRLVFVGMLRGIAKAATDSARRKA